MKSAASVAWGIDAAEYFEPCHGGVDPMEDPWAVLVDVIFVRIFDS